MNRTFRRLRGAAMIGAVPTATPPKQKLLRVVGIGKSSYWSLAGFLYTTLHCHSGLSALKVPANGATDRLSETSSGSRPALVLDGDLALDTVPRCRGPRHRREQHRWRAATRIQSEKANWRSGRLVLQLSDLIGNYATRRGKNPNMLCESGHCRLSLLLFGSEYLTDGRD